MWDRHAGTVFSLPNHLLAAAFDAAGPDALPALRLTCKGFLGPANEATRCLKLRRVYGICLSNFPCLIEVDASFADDWSEGWLMQLADQAPLLESLKLGGPLTFVGAEALARLTRLQRLDLAGPLADSVLQRLPALSTSLCSLSLRECCAASSSSLAVALGGLSNLEEADLSMCAHLNDAVLQQLAVGCPRLHKLDVTGCELFSEAGLRHLACLPIRTLIMSACCQLTDACLAAVAEGLPQLRCLGLFEAGEGVTDEGLAALSRLGGSLTALDMGYSCWSHTAEGLAGLVPTLPKLQMLNIGGCEGTTDAVVAAVAQHCRQLTMLDVSESQRMTAAAVRQLAQLPALLELNLGWNIRLGDAALERLPASLTKLDLSFCGEMSDAGLAHLSQLPRLASCVLRKCNRVTDGGLRSLARCAALRHLDLSYTSITATGLAHLRCLRWLSSLVLVDCLRAVHPPCMMLLGEMPALVTLDASNNKRLDDGCMQTLSHAPKLRCLSLNNCSKVSDRGLLALTRCASLRQLSVDRCPQLSAAALRTLQRKLVLLRLARPAGGRTVAAVSAQEY